jgi:hypothetical protein
MPGHDNQIEGVLPGRAFQLAFHSFDAGMQAGDADHAGRRIEAAEAPTMSIPPRFG